MVVEDAATPERPESVEGGAKFGAETINVQKPKVGERWRCVKCYSTRFATMCFGEQEVSETQCCKFCGSGLVDAGWTVEMKFDDLPEGLKRRIDGNESKLLSTLRTRWGGCEIMFDQASSEDGSSLMLGTVDTATIKLPVV
jgi:hypothetical protein